MDRQGDDMGLQIRALRELVGGECGMELVPEVVGADPGAFKLAEQRFRLVDDEREGERASAVRQCGVKRLRSRKAGELLVEKRVVLPAPPRDLEVRAPVSDTAGRRADRPVRCRPIEGDVRVQARIEADVAFCCDVTCTCLRVIRAVRAGWRGWRPPSPPVRTAGRHALRRSSEERKRRSRAEGRQFHSRPAVGCSRARRRRTPSGASSAS